MNELMQKNQPLWVGAGAAYPPSPELAKRYTRLSHFGDEIRLYHETPGKILLPRELCPTAEIDRRVDGIDINVKDLFVPRSDEQHRVVSESAALLAAGRSHLIEAPTGFGKTYIGAALIARLRKKTLIVLTKEDIKSQWVDALTNVLGLAKKEIGLIQGDIIRVADYPVVLTMVQSICKKGRYPSWVYKEFGMVMFDETHRMGADKFSQAAWLLPAKLRVGLSASPYRRDGKDIVFKAHIGPVLVRSEAYPLIPKVIHVPYQKPLPKGDVRGGRTAWLEKILRMDPVRNRALAEAIARFYERDRNIVFFSSTLAHLQTMHDLIVARGVPRNDIGFYVGGLTDEQRSKAKSKSVVLATYAMTSEATDAPWWDTAVLGSPRADVLQIVGRVLREYEGKCNVGEAKEGERYPIVLDLEDLGHAVLRGYARKRRAFYKKLGAPVSQVRMERLL